jgi:hypothetical protein
MLACPAIFGQRTTTTRCDPPSSFDDDTLSALVMIAALASAVRTQIVTMHGQIRLVIASLHVSGYHPQSGWTVEVRAAERHKPISQQVYKQEVMRLLMLMTTSNSIDDGKNKLPLERRLFSLGS